MAHVAEYNQPKCRRCGRRMTLGRRVPVPALGYEFRTFECLRCGDTCIEKIASSGARAMPRPPAGATSSKKAVNEIR
jgi:tRNA(Ile2) C34 agmatinyltransferase TiaS